MVQKLIKGFTAERKCKTVYLSTHTDTHILPSQQSMNTQANPRWWSTLFGNSVTDVVIRVNYSAKKCPLVVDYHQYNGETTRLLKFSFSHIQIWITLFLQNCTYVCDIFCWFLDFKSCIFCTFLSGMYGLIYRN